MNMRVSRWRRVSLGLALVLSSSFALAQAARPKPDASASPADAPAPQASAPAPAAPGPDTRSAAMAAYNRALAERRLETSEPLTPALVGERLLEVQELSGAGRRDEVIGALVRLVESPRFADFADGDQGHAAVF